MISKKLHEKLIKKWKKYGKCYQLRSKRVIDRMKWLDRHLHLLDGLNVLEVGSNAGLFAIDICKKSTIYIGTEKKENYYNQFKITQNECKLYNSWIYNCDVSEVKSLNNKDLDFNIKDINAVVLMRVLYYLKEEEVVWLRENVLRNCKIALVYCGSAKDRKNNSYGFHKIENASKFFEECGMKFAVDLKHERYFGGLAKR